METSDILSALVGQPESSQLEYKATLISSRAIAQILASFANAEGGTLILGVRELPKAKYKVEGLSNDFNVTAMINKAITLMQPVPALEASYFTYQEKQLFGVQVRPSKKAVIVEGKYFKRIEDRVVNIHNQEAADAPVRHPGLQAFEAILESQKQDATEAKVRFLDHYAHSLKLYEPILGSHFPADFTVATADPAAKVLNRMMFSSCVDNFEIYLGELLYQIYIARPEILKGTDAMIKIAEVLECADIEEVVQRFAARRVSNLNKGSIKGFLEKTPEIEKLKALSESQIADIEKILQVRHLYAHRNGIVDENFLKHYRGQYTIGQEHQLSISDMLDKLQYLVDIVTTIDKKAADKYELSTKNP